MMISVGWSLIQYDSRLWLILVFRCKIVLRNSTTWHAPISILKLDIHDMDTVWYIAILHNLTLLYLVLLLPLLLHEWVSLESLVSFSLVVVCPYPSHQRCLVFSDFEKPYYADVLGCCSRLGLGDTLGWASKPSPRLPTMTSMSLSTLKARQVWTVYRTGVDALSTDNR